MRNKYILYRVNLVKGMLMYTDVDNTIADNIIQAEADFEDRETMKTGCEYVITIEKL